MGRASSKVLRFVIRRLSFWREKSNLLKIAPCKNKIRGENMKITEKSVEIPLLVDEKTAAMLLSMSYTKLRKTVRPQNKIAYVRIGASVKYTLADLKAYLAKCRVEAVN